MHLQAHTILLVACEAKLHSTTHRYELSTYTSITTVTSSALWALFFLLSLFHNEAVSTPRIAGLDVDSVSGTRHLDCFILIETSRLHK